MKKIMMIIALLASSFAFAEQLTIAPDPLEHRLKKEEFQKLPPEQRRAYLDRLSYINNGGHVIKANTGKGIIKVIVSSDKFDFAILESNDLRQGKCRSLCRGESQIATVANRTRGRLGHCQCSSAE